MALGGGTFTSQNKILPGTYINIISKTASADAGDRGIVAIPLSLNWGAESKVFTVNANDMPSKSVEIFGYEYEDDEMWSIRELFVHAKKVLAYRLTSGGTKASNTFATALYGGTRGNDISIVITVNVDDATKFDVATKLGTKVLDTQTVSAATALVANKYVTFKTTATLSAGTTKLTGGTNGTADGTAYQAALDAFENETFNILALDSVDSTTIALYEAYMKRMRDNMGVKFQLVAYKASYDYEGVIDVESTTTDTSITAAALVYWTAGAEAGCVLGKSITNNTYDGELTIKTDLTQTALEDAIKSGKFVFHKVGTEVRVLLDINSLVTYTSEKSELFASNDTIRAIDYLASSVSSLFNDKYIGMVMNNASGRVALWSDVVSIHRAMETAGVITDFDPNDVTITAGEGKGDVVINDAITIVNAMEKLYMTAVIQ